MLRGYRHIVLAALGLLVLGQHEQGRAARQDNQTQNSAQPAAVPKPPSPKRADTANQQCYPGSEPRISCDGITAKAAVDQARDADKQAAPIMWQLGVGIFTLFAAVGAAIFAWRAAHHTKRSADIAHDSVRPWIAISCKVEKLTKGASAVNYRALISFYNTGDFAAESFNAEAKADVFFSDARDHAEAKWDQFKSARTDNQIVLLPKETYSDIAGVWARTDLENEAFGEPQPCVLIVIAAANFKFVGSDEWHTTERSFSVGICLEPDLVPQEWILPDAPDREFAPHEIRVRQLFVRNTT